MPPEPQTAHGRDAGHGCRHHGGDRPLGHHRDRGRAPGETGSWRSPLPQRRSLAPGGVPENSLPASLDSSGRAVHYITGADSVELDNVAKKDRQFQNRFATQAFLPGVDQYRCCPHDYGMGRPYLAEELWLVAVMYAACEVTAKVADGTEVTFAEETGYPFTDTATLRLKAEGAAALPAGAAGARLVRRPEIKVNGRRVDAPAGLRPAAFHALPVPLPAPPGAGSFPMTELDRTKETNR